MTNENVLLAVKLDKYLDVRTMYVITDNKLQNYLNSGRIKKVLSIIYLQRTLRIEQAAIAPLWSERDVERSLHQCSL